MQRSYRTPKGTELPLLNLRGREYLEVKYRLVWFREEHADWAIETELLSVTQESAYARAVIKDEKGRVIATSHKFETKKGFPDFIEKAETGSIGRALALIGFGTQFCADELDEGDRIVDAPVDRASRSETSQVDAEDDRAEASAPVSETPASQPSSRDPADYRISFGKKYKGMKLREIPRNELEGYVEWLEDNAAKKGLPLSEEARFLKVAVGRYLNQSEGAPSSH
ncbi:MAG: hypothetical protein V4760_11975 [Bdellovibrionota bacterium]